MQIEAVSEPKLDSLNQAATEDAKAILKIMTKVIFGGTDEMGGCRSASPKVLEALKEESGAWHEARHPRRS